MDSLVQVIKQKDNIMRLIVRVPDDAQRARITMSYDAMDWELTELLPTNGQEWMQRPDDGWSPRQDIYLPEDILEDDAVLFRLEFQE
jgi:hypothetical protein